MMEGPVRVLVLYGVAIGDRNNLEGLARQLGWPYEMLNLDFSSRSIIDAITQRNPTELKPEHLSHNAPNVILTATGGAMHYALAVKRATAKPVVVIKMGRPFFNAVGLDLSLQTKQFFRFPFHRIISLDLPFHIVSPQELQIATHQSANVFAHLPRPRTALLIGGSTGALVWNDQIAKEIGRQVNNQIKAQGGSLLLSTSRRTGASAEQELDGQITVPHASHLWSAGGSNNPFLAYLAAADRVVVTEDSSSMIAEASATGKPVEIVRLKPMGFFANLLRQRPILARFGREAMLLDLHRKKYFTWFGSEAGPTVGYQSQTSERQKAAVNEIKIYISKKIGLPEP